jgi:WD40 repeat protein
MCLANALTLSKLDQVFDLEDYRQKATLSGHRGSVLALLLSSDEKLLFSSAADRFVNVRSPAQDHSASKVA